MLPVLRRYFDVAIKRWASLVVLLMGLPAVFGAFGANVGLPPWGWGMIALGALSVIQFQAWRAADAKGGTPSQLPPLPVTITTDVTRTYWVKRLPTSPVGPSIELVVENHSGHPLTCRAEVLPVEFRATPADEWAPHPIAPPRLLWDSRREEDVIPPNGRRWVAIARPEVINLFTLGERNYEPDALIEALEPGDWRVAVTIHAPDHLPRVVVVAFRVVRGGPSQNAATLLPHECSGLDPITSELSNRGALASEP